MKKRILASLLSLCLLLGLLPTTAWATGGESEGGGSTTAAGTLSDNISVESTSNVTRAQLAEMVYEHASLKTDIDSMAYGGSEPNFTDISVSEGGVTQDQHDAIIALYKAKIISGTTATTFNPSGTVTRGEFAVVLWRATGSRSNKTAMTGQFTDTLESWYAPAVNCFYGAGLVSGTASGEFKGGAKISVEGVNSFLTAYATNKTAFINNTESGSTTRAEMTVEFYEKFKPELSKLATTKTWNDPFNDLFGCTEEQVEAIKFFYEREIISGTSDTTFRPHTPVSNFQIAALLQKCATKEIPAETQETISLFSAAPLAEQTPVEWLKAQGLDVSAAENNPDAPALNTTLTTWRDGLAPDAPTFAPESGATFTDSQTVTISAGSEDEGAAIYYTLDTTQPSTSSTPYSGGITITDTTTIKAISVKNNLVSEIVTATYTRQTQEPEQPVLSISPSSASLSGGGTVTFTITDAPADTEVKVTCNVEGITPSLGTDGKWSATLPNASATYTFTATAGEGESAVRATCTVEVTYKSTSSGSTGGSSEPSYSPVMDVSDGGTVRVSPRTPSAGDDVTLTVTPDSGYEVGDVTVTDRSGREVDVTAGRDGTYTFTQPAGRVTIEVTFAPVGGETVFTDVPETFWAYDEIMWAQENGYVNGVTATTFSPNATISRQQIWMILARISGYDPADMAAARAWSISSGISDGTNPGGAVTRQQLAALLYRFAESQGHDVTQRADLSAYPDAGSVSDYAVEPLQWAVAEGIVSGTTAGTLNPQGTATRAQFAVMLYRFLAV